jgi:hypothetical protein
MNPESGLNRAPNIADLKGKHKLATVPFKPKVEKVPVKVKPAGLNPVEFKEDSALKGAFVFLIAGANGLSDSLTVHHPIGYTKLGDDDWVCTPSKEVQTLLSRKDNPNERKLHEQRKTLTMKLAVSQKLLLEKEGSKEFFLPNGKARTPISNYLNNLGKNEQEPLPHGYTKEDVEAEKLYREFARDKETQLKVIQEIPDNYETRGGTFEDQPQVPIRDAKGLTEGQVRTLLMRRIFT